MALEDFTVYDTYCKMFDNFRYGSVSPAYRSAVGLQCKHLLDYGRLVFLESHGYGAALRKYIDQAVTVENVVLIGQKI